MIQKLLIFPILSRTTSTPSTSTNEKMIFLGDEPMMIQYDDEIVGTTRFNVEESSNR